MPRVVDHESRRNRVAEVAAQLIERGGLEGVTFRDIAEAAGCSTAIVSHYFTDKLDVLRYTDRAAEARARQRLDAALSRDPADLQGALEALLPLDAGTRRDWRVAFAFWGPATTDKEMAARQRGRVKSVRQDIAGVLWRMDQRGELAPGVDIEEAARDLLVVVMGVASQAVFDPTDWPAERQRAFVRRSLTRFGIADQTSG